MYWNDGRFQQYFCLSLTQFDKLLLHISPRSELLFYCCLIRKKIFYNVQKSADLDLCHQNLTWLRWVSDWLTWRILFVKVKIFLTLDELWLPNSAATGKILSCQTARSCTALKSQNLQSHLYIETGHIQCTNCVRCEKFFLFLCICGVCHYFEHLWPQHLMDPVGGLILICLYCSPLPFLRFHTKHIYFLDRHGVHTNTHPDPGAH